MMLRDEIYDQLQAGIQVYLFIKKIMQLSYGSFLIEHINRMCEKNRF